jgi:hypothetical protein
VPAVADRLQGGKAGNRDGRGLLEGEVPRFGRQLVRPGARVLGEGALGDAEHLVAHRQRRHGRADRLDAPGDLTAPHPGLGGADSVAREAHRVGQAGHEVPDAPVHAGRVYAQQHLTVADRGPGGLPEAQRLAGLAVMLLDDRLHGRLVRRVAGIHEISFRWSTWAWGKPAAGC